MADHDSGLSVQRNVLTEKRVLSDIDIQVATARAYPRSLAEFKNRALSYATLDIETAESCFYVLERGGKKIQGPSVRLAEIALSAWGNIRAKAEIVDEDKKFVISRGHCWDLETNAAVAMDVRRRITDKNGHTFKDDMIAVTCNAANAISLRNAIFKVIPAALIHPIYLQAVNMAVGDVKTLDERRRTMVERFLKQGVKEERIYIKLNCRGIEDVTLDDLKTMIGVFNAIRDGDSSIDDQFPEPEKTVSGSSGTPKTKGEQVADRMKSYSNGPQSGGGENSESSNDEDLNLNEHDTVTEKTVDVETPADTGAIPPEGDRRRVRRSRTATEDKKTEPVEKSSESPKTADSGGGSEKSTDGAKETAEAGSGENSAAGSHLEECRLFMKESGIECFEHEPPPHESLKYNLPDNRKLYLSDKTPPLHRDGWLYVTTVEADALEQVKNIVETAQKRANR